MKVPGWLLVITMSFLTSRQLRVRYEDATYDPRKLDSGAPAGCRTGNIIFLVKFPGPISKNTAAQEKYIDDQYVATSINLRKSLHCVLVAAIIVKALK